MHDDYIVLILLMVLVLGVGVVSLVLAITATTEASSLRQTQSILRKELEWLRTRVERMERSTGSIPAQPAGATPVSPPPAPAAAQPVLGAAPITAGAAPPPGVSPSPARPPALGSPAAASGGASPSAAPGRSLPAPSVPTVEPQGLESVIGQRWIAWAGAIVVFFSAVFFLKYAFDNAWIGPTGQVSLCALLSVVMLAVGSRFIRKGWRILGQAVMGMGLGILYATFYAAFAVYHPPVMSQQTAFASMVVVTAAGTALAVLHDALTIAFLAVLGGLLTPVLVSTGQDSRDVLFAYLLLLDLGVMAIAFFRGWRALDALALVGTVFLFGGWFTEFYKPAALGPALAWLGAFYLVFLVLPFCHQLLRKRPLELERFAMALGNALFASVYAWHMLHDEYLFALGFAMLGMAGAYLALGALVRRRIPDDARALFGLIAMSVMFLTLAIPMQFKLHGILLAWVAEAPVVTYLGYRFRYRPARVFGAVVLLVGVGRLFFSPVHWPPHSRLLFDPFFNRQFLSAMAVPAAAAVFAYIHRRNPSQETAVDRALKVGAALGAGMLALVILDAETQAWLRNDLTVPPLPQSALTALWALGAAAYLWAGTRAARVSTWVWAVGAIAILVAAAQCLAGFNESLGPAHLLFLNARFGAGLLLAAVVFAYAWAVPSQPSPLPQSARTAGNFFFVVAAVGLLTLLSTEVHSFCMDVVSDDTSARRAGQMSITLVWGLYAAALLVIGFWRQWRSLRLAGLALFGLAAVKLAVVDLTFLKDIYRIVAFLILGLLMLAASYLYHRLEKRLTAAAIPATPPAAPPAPPSGIPRPKPADAP